MPDGSDVQLARVLADVQRRGGIGPVPIAEAIAHSERFAALVPAGASSAADLGSGGGLPGLVIAVRRPDLGLLLIERRDRRADLLEFAVRALGLDGRVHVHRGDVATAAAADPRVDVVTARAFGPLRETLAAAGSLLGRRGTVLVSDPPEERVADGQVLADLRLTDCGVTHGIHVFER